MLGGGDGAKEPGGPSADDDELIAGRGVERADGGSFWQEGSPCKEGLAKGG